LPGTTPNISGHIGGHDGDLPTVTRGSEHLSPPKEPTRFGRIFAPDDAWLARQLREPVLDPDLPIIDTHHHLWHRPDHRYLLDEFLADVRTGHNVVATVFVECRAMYRADGPAEMRPVGQTEFVTGVAAMSASGIYGPARVAAAIVGFADFPVEKMGTGYATLWNAFKRIAAGASADEKLALFSGTARRAYRLA